jgi:kynurenine formamidase
MGQGREPGKPPPWATADYIAASIHSYANTHIDALNHMFWQGKMYNGFDSAEVGPRGGKCGIDVARDGVVGRGVLLDIPRLKNLDWLEPGTPIFPEDLDLAERHHGVKLGEGDIMLLRVGREARRKAQGAWDPTRMAGLHVSCLPWLHERKIAVLGCDGNSDLMPSGFDDNIFPIHFGTIVMMGVHLIDGAALETLSQTCARLKRYAFMFVLSPLLLERGAGSLVNPLAIF